MVSHRPPQPGASSRLTPCAGHYTTAAVFEPSCAWILVGKLFPHTDLYTHVTERRRQGGDFSNLNSRRLAGRCLGLEMQTNSERTLVYCVLQWGHLSIVPSFFVPPLIALETLALLRDVSKPVHFLFGIAAIPFPTFSLPTRRRPILNWTTYLRLGTYQTTKLYT